MSLVRVLIIRYEEKPDGLSFKLLFQFIGPRHLCCFDTPSQLVLVAMYNMEKFILIIC